MAPLFPTFPDDGSAGELLRRSERNGRSLGVDSAPSWLLAGRLVRGLLSREELEQLAQSAQDPRAPSGER
jgi:hypothetical protein